MKNKFKFFILFYIVFYFFNCFFNIFCIDKFFTFFQILNFFPNGNFFLYFFNNNINSMGGENVKKNYEIPLNRELINKILSFIK